MSRITKTSLRFSLLGASALAAVAPTAARSQATYAPDVTIRDNLNPDAGPNGPSLDPVDINGIGQMTVDAGGGYVGLCTGTLINPRTVIFAAHCVNDQAANSYGAASGGTAISFGFHSDNLPAIIDWLGFGDDPTQKYKTNLTNALYNVEQVWYDPRSLALGPNLNFLQGDVAIATLDTPATKIPTWTLLFSPLTSQTHATITGYGNYGNGTQGQIDLDFRRRAAENMVSVLGSLDDVDSFLFGEPDGLPQSLYQMDFDDPKRASEFDFDIFKGDALTKEGLTAQGDSGGPLIIDKAFNKPVVAGTLSGGSTYFDDQPFSGYGSTSFYQPLFLFWDQIVANNPYKYVGSKAGIGDWTDPTHWVQLMDPNYAVIRNGKLVNALPNTPAQGVTGDTYKFGQVCDGASCTTIAPDGSAVNSTSGSGLVIPGGPGSTNFVPNNVVGTPTTKAKYYDVTLAATGITTLSKSVTIDRLTINGATILDVKAPGRLTVLGDYTQGVGWTNVDGLLKAGESVLIGGILTGSGTFDPTYLTSVKGTIAPGGLATTGTLTVKGDVILSSGNALYLDLTGTRGDLLAVKADAQNAGRLAVDGTALVTQGIGTPVRYGQTFTVATADGGVQGKFANVYSLLPGVLKADFRYSANKVDAVIAAGSLLDLLKGIGGAAKEALKFAAALDSLRGNDYNKLAGVFGSVDIMSGQQLAQSLRGLAPKTATYARTAQDRQRATAINLVADRLSVIGGGKASGLTLTGAPSAMLRLAAGAPARGLAERQSFVGMGFASTPHTVARLPDGMSGFVASGYTLDGGQSAGDRYDGQRSWHLAAGLEQEVATGTTLGVASSFGMGNRGIERSTDWARDEVAQVALYGSRKLGKSGYVGALVSALHATADTGRRLALGQASYDLRGAPAMNSYTLGVESGINLALGRSLTLTPRAGIRYALTRTGGYSEAGGDAALRIDSQRYAQAETRLGTKLAGAKPLGGGWSFEPHVQLDWVHNLSGADAGLTTRFLSARDIAIDLPGDTRARDWAELRGGFQITNGALAFGVTADASTARREVGDNRALASVAWRFN